MRRAKVVAQLYSYCTFRSISIHGGLAAAAAASILPILSVIIVDVQFVNCVPRGELTVTL